MAYCQKCGKEINDDADVCVNCGTLVAPKNNTNTTDRPASALEIIITILIPIVGAVLYYAYKNDKPTAAKTLNKIAIIAFVVYLLAGFFVR